MPTVPNMLKTKKGIIATDYEGVTKIFDDGKLFIEFDDKKITLFPGMSFSNRTKRLWNEASDAYGLGFSVYNRWGELLIYPKRYINDYSVLKFATPVESIEILRGPS